MPSRSRSSASDASSSPAGSAAIGMVAIVERDHLASLPAAEFVPEQIAGDGEQPAPEGRGSPPSAQCAKRPEQGLLHQVVDVLGRCAGAVQKSADRGRVAPDQLGRGRLVATEVSRYQLGISGEVRHGRSAHSGCNDVACRGLLSDRYLWCPCHDPEVIAHRGASGYEYENSRAAFRRAVMLDADGVELDVHATSRRRPRRPSRRRDSRLRPHRPAHAGAGPTGPDPQRRVAPVAERSARAGGRARGVDRGQDPSRGP